MNHIAKVEVKLGHSENSNTEFWKRIEYPQVGYIPENLRSNSTLQDLVVCFTEYKKGFAISHTERGLGYYSDAWPVEYFIPIPVGTKITLTF